MHCKTSILPSSHLISLGSNEAGQLHCQSNVTETCSLRSFTYYTCAPCSFYTAFIFMGGFRNIIRRIFITLAQELIGRLICIFSISNCGLFGLLLPLRNYYFIYFFLSFMTDFFCIFQPVLYTRIWITCQNK